MDEKLEYNNVLTKLTFLTKRNNLSNTEIGNAINVERRAMSGRADRNSKFRHQEIKMLEEAYDINFKDISIQTNTLDRQNDTTIPEKIESFGIRLTELQDKHEYLDKDMAKLLRITEEEYIDIKLGDIEPDFNVLVRLKQCFKVSIDWLLFGE